MNGEPLLKDKDKKIKKIPLKKIKKELWEHCKRIIRARYALKTHHNALETWECYTCGKVITNTMDAHTAHFIAKSICGTFLKYDLRNLRICCYRCNVWLTGNGTYYYKNMVEREGQEYVDQIFRDKGKTVKESDFLPQLLEEYKRL